MEIQVANSPSITVSEESELPKRIRLGIQTKYLYINLHF